MLRIPVLQELLFSCLHAECCCQQGITSRHRYISSERTMPLQPDSEAGSSCADAWVPETHRRGAEGLSDACAETQVRTKETGSSSEQQLEGEEVSKAEGAPCTCRGGGCRALMKKSDGGEASCRLRRRGGCSCKQLRNIFVASLYDGGIIAAAVPPSHRLPFVSKPLRTPRGHRASGKERPRDGVKAPERPHREKERDRRIRRSAHSSGNYLHAMEGRSDDVLRHTPSRERPARTEGKEGERTSTDGEESDDEGLVESQHDGEQTVAAVFASLYDEFAYALADLSPPLLLPRPSLCPVHSHKRAGEHGEQEKEKGQEEEAFRRGNGGSSGAVALVGTTGNNSEDDSLPQRECTGGERRKKEARPRSEGRLQWSSGICLCDDLREQRGEEEWPVMLVASERDKAAIGPFFLRSTDGELEVRDGDHVPCPSCRGWRSGEEGARSSPSSTGTPGDGKRKGGAKEGERGSAGTGENSGEEDPEKQTTGETETSSSKGGEDFASGKGGGATSLSVDIALVLIVWGTSQASEATLFREYERVRKLLSKRMISLV